MSRLFSRIAKDSVRRGEKGLFSSLPQSPYLLLNFFPGEKDSNGVITFDLKFWDPRKEEEVKITNWKLPEKHYAHSETIGSSLGWMALMNHKDFTIHLTDAYSPYKPSDSSPTFISLPPLVDSNYRLVKNVCISSSSNQLDQDDCVVAIKFRGPKICFCRLGKDSKWTVDIDTLDHPYFYSSDVMFSKRDHKFYLPAFGSHYLHSWDLTYKPKLHKLRFRNLPELDLSHSCTWSEHLVESPSGEVFVVKWYFEPVEAHYEDDIDIAMARLMGEPVYMDYETKRFMVFRQDETREYVSYTEDIGDVCIFLGKGQPFCLRASRFPGLNPNSVYYLHNGFVGVYDITAARTIRTVNPFAFEGWDLNAWFPPLFH